MLLKRQEIQNTLADRRAEIVSGELLVFFEDESHLVWGNTQGYGWGRRNERTPVLIENQRQRQTYYGALNLYNQEFILRPSARGNGSCTVEFIKYLQGLYPHQKLMIIWDGARYHSGKKMQAYLNHVNQGLEEKDRIVTCILLAPYAPKQNLLQDVWLRGKNFLRIHFHEGGSFYKVKSQFFNFINKRVFNFRKCGWYTNIPQST